MKEFNAVSRKSASLKSTIQNTIENHDKYKKSYFWSPGGNASSRRRNEERFEKSNPSYKVQTKKGIIEVRPDYSESCRNCYYKLSITLDGNSKNVRLLKNIIK